jgi:hypothetical protein
MLDLFSIFYLYKLHFLLNHSYTICREKCNWDFICIYLHVYLIYFTSWTSLKKYATSTGYSYELHFLSRNVQLPIGIRYELHFFHKKYLSLTNIWYELHFLLRKVQLFCMYFLISHLVIFMSCTFPEKCAISEWFLKLFAHFLKEHEFTIWFSIWVAVFSIIFSTQTEPQYELHFSQEICNSNRILKWVTFFKEACKRFSVWVALFLRNMQLQPVSKMSSTFLKKMCSFLVMDCTFLKKYATATDFCYEFTHFSKSENRLQLHFSQKMCNCDRCSELHFC